MLDGRAGDDHRIENRNRSSGAGASDTDHDVTHLSRALLSRIFKRNGAAGSFPDDAEFLVNCTVVDFDDHAVGAELEAFANGAEAIDFREHVVDVMENAIFAGSLKTKIAKRPISVVMRFQIRLHEVVGHELQGALRGDFRIELANRSGGEVAWIGEFLFAALFLLLVQSFKIGFEDYDFAADFDGFGGCCFGVFDFIERFGGFCGFYAFCVFCAAEL